MLSRRLCHLAHAEAVSIGRRPRVALLSFLTPALFLLTVAGAGAQQPVEPATANEPLKVFLDCTAKCDEDFLRVEIPVISYVRDRQDADLHVLVTTQPTASGGAEFTLAFIGLRRFAGIDHTLKYAASQTATDDERRRGLAEVLKSGLVRYVSDTPLAGRMTITFLPEKAAVRATPVADRWNLWVFRTTFLGTFNGESSNSGRSVRLDAAASRTSDRWKVSLATGATYHSDRFVLTGDQRFRSITRGFGFDGLVVKSVTDHWSAGAIASASSSTFLNYDLKMRVAVGPEYNVFPYSASTRKLLTVQYTIGGSSFDYREETIFGVRHERLGDHRLGVLFAMLQPWGTAGAEASFSQFLAKPDQNNLNATGQANVRVTRGFSLNALVTVSRPRDQLYLPAGAATLEEILVRERQLATTYRYSTVFGFTYTFGSIFNNVVNPRFGRAGDDAPLF